MPRDTGKTHLRFGTWKVALMVFNNHLCFVLSPEFFLFCLVFPLPVSGKLWTNCFFLNDSETFIWVRVNDSETWCSMFINPLFSGLELHFRQYINTFCFNLHAMKNWRSRSTVGFTILRVRKDVWPWCTSYLANFIIYLEFIRRDYAEGVSVMFTTKRCRR